MPSVERVQWAKFRVGALSVAALLILGTLLYLLTGGTLLEPKATIYLYMPDAMSLAAGAPVRVDGIGVGKVESVVLSGDTQPNRVVKVAMIVDRARLASIPDDSTAQASADNLVGDKFVDIAGGKSPTRIKPGAVIIYKASPDMMKRLDVSEFRNQLGQMDALLTQMESAQSPLGKLVQGEEMYRSLVKRVAEFRNTVRAAADTTTDLGKLIFTDAAYQQAAASVHRIDQSLAQIQSGQGPLGQLLRDEGQYAQLRASLNDLRKTMQELRANEMITSDQQYADWNRQVSALARIADDFASNPMLATTADFDNLTGMAKELRDSMKEFRENPKKFLRLKVF